MFFGDYGIETGHHIPEHEGVYCVANTIRALLDLLYERNYPAAQGMNDDFICNAEYDTEVFQKVYLMSKLPYWDEINDFMKKEYELKWIEYLRSKNERTSG